MKSIISVNLEFETSCKDFIHMHGILGTEQGNISFRLEFISYRKYEKQFFWDRKQTIS